MVVVVLGYDFLFKSLLAHCECPILSLEIPQRCLPVDAAVDVGETVVVAAFDADVASEHASSFVVASYVVVAVVSVWLLSFYFGESKNSWTF